MARPSSPIERRQLQPLGPRLRHERLSRGLSLTRLAQAAGLTKSLLSQVERGIAEPSLSSLRKLALALGVPLSRFFSEPVRLGAVVRRGEGKEIRWARLGVTYEVLSSDDQQHIQLLLLRLARGGKTCERPTPGRSAGEECALVLAGTVEVVVGDQTYRLGEGDSISFDCTAAHQYANIGTKPALLVAAMSTSTL